jgi:hypothetical protein
MTLIVAAILTLFMGGAAYCDSGPGPSYEDTITLISKTMATSTSGYREESYGYINFNKCNLDYNVSGKYPAGPGYNIKFSGIDFANLNSRDSKLGHDYTAFVILNFNKSLEYSTGNNALKIRTVVVNLSDDESARVLFRAFLHLGALCGAPSTQGRQDGETPGKSEHGLEKN